MQTKQFCCLALLCGLLLTAACHSSSSNQPGPQPPQQTAPRKQKPDEAAAPAPPHPSLIKAATDKALEYTQKNKKLDPNAALVLHFLNRKFNLGSQYDFSHFYKKYPISDPRGRALERMVNPNVKATAADFGSRYKGTSLVDHLSNTSYMMNCALMCDKIPLPDDYFGLLEQQTQLGRYFLTHAALSLQWLKENGCITDQTRADKLKNLQTELLSKLIVEVEQPSDLGMEAVAVLLYIGGRDKLNPQRITNIINTQLPDGGWPLGKNSAKQAHDHATVHALWALLEYANPKAPATSWIVKN